MSGFWWNLPFWLACGIAALIIAWPERAETVRRRRLPRSTYFANELGFSRDLGRLAHRGDNPIRTGAAFFYGGGRLAGLLASPTPEMESRSHPISCGEAGKD